MFTYQHKPVERAEKGKTLSKIYTPPLVADFLHQTVKHLKPEIVLDPACGTGNLLVPWKKCLTVGVDTDMAALATAEHRGIRTTLSNFETYACPFTPGLILCNPPWNGNWKGESYPEVFLRRIVTLFGKDIPIVFLCPMGLRLNQAMKSRRWKWIRDTLTITSIVSCPRDLYPNTEFHSEIIFFNIRRVKPHYWLPL